MSNNTIVNGTATVKNTTTVNFTACFPPDSGPKVDNDADPKLYLEMPDVEMINKTTLNTTKV